MNRAQRRYLNATVGLYTRPTNWARNDAEWFKRRPDRSHRVRDRFPGEEFGSRDDPTLDMVAVKQITTGIRARSAFEIPDSSCAEHVREAAATEHGASIMFDLAVRGGGPIRCDVILAILEQGRAPGGHAH